MSHTPPPWRVRCTVDRNEDLRGTDRYFHIGAGAETWHDNIGHFHPDDARYVIDEIKVVALGYDRDYDSPEGGIRNEADAHLIAAAPETLSALKKLLAEITACLGIATDEIREAIGPTNITVLAVRSQEADAALAKAEGR